MLISVLLIRPTVIGLQRRKVELLRINPPVPLFLCPNRWVTTVNNCSKSQLTVSFTVSLGRLTRLGEDSFSSRRRGVEFRGILGEVVGFRGLLSSRFSGYVSSLKKRTSGVCPIEVDKRGMEEAQGVKTKKAPNSHPRPSGHSPSVGDPIDWWVTSPFFTSSSLLDLL